LNLKITFIWFSSSFRPSYFHCVELLLASNIEFSKKQFYNLFHYLRNQ